MQLIQIHYFLTPLTSAPLLSQSCEISEIPPPLPISTFDGPPLPKTSKTLSYGHFEDALKHIAEKKKIEYEKLVESISSHGVQSYTGTKADYVKFHDDKSLYTGVYAKGGPSNVDIGNGGGISDISQLCDRTGADVRGVKK